MSVVCATCQSTNRNEAKFCKHCGKAIQATMANGTGADPLQGLIGLDTIREALVQQRAIMQAMKESGATQRLSFNTIIVGNSGTAKSLIGEMIAQVFHQGGVTSKAKPVVLDGNLAQDLSADDLKQLFSSAKGGVLFVDNAQRLVTEEGKPQLVFNQLVGDMDAFRDDPIVVLAGLPYGFREFIQKSENRNITGRFQNIFTIPDYTLEQLNELITYELGRSKLVLSPEAQTKLVARCRFLAKESRKPDSTLNAYNGYLARIESQAILSAYYKRKGTTLVIEPDDISGKADEKKTIEKILAELDSIIGMDNIKAEIKSLYQQISQQQKMASNGLAIQKLARHFVITGNPGTGKTTIARLMGNVFEAIGLLSSGHVVEVDRSKLVASYIGQTAPNVNRYCDLAMGGILFIDEAYTLASGSSGGASGGSGDFGQEAIDALLKRMEDDRDKFMVIVAGYQKPMENFLAANEGLKSRFTKTFELKDYVPDELTAIFLEFVKKQNYQVSAEATARVKAFFVERCARKTKDFANGREARNLFDVTRANQAERLVKLGGTGQACSATELVTIEAADVPGTTAENAISLDEALLELNRLVGLTSVKTTINRLAKSLKSRQLTGDTSVVAKHFVFNGNPGTGKTTVARVMAKLFKAIGLMPTDTLIEVDRSKLVGQTVGSTAPLVNKHCDLAMGGVLFIDEAYGLKQSDNDNFGQEAIDTLLKRMEDDRGKFVVIAAGYTKEMADFIASNSGLKSRFTDYIEFEDYTPEEMERMFVSLAKDRNYGYEDGFLDTINLYLTELYRNRLPGFANARTVRQLFEQTLENVSTRVLDAPVPLDDQSARRELLIMRSVDLPASSTKKLASVEDALKELNELVGLASVKQSVNKLITTMRSQKISGEVESIAKHFVFYGNPGTGKTTVARIMADIFCAIGVTPTNKLVEVDRSKLVASFVGQTGPLVNKQCDAALGGVLFIDEAYALKQGSTDSFGQEAIDTLLKRMEDDRGKYIVIAAGYSKEMEAFLDTNSGFRSRFTDYITFEDYAPPEMKNIFLKAAQKRGIEFEPGFDAALELRLHQLYANRSPNFANARTVRQLFDKSRENLSNRVLDVQAEPADDAALNKALHVMTIADLDQTLKA